MFVYVINVRQKGNNLYKLIRVRKEKAKEKETSNPFIHPKFFRKNIFLYFFGKEVKKDESLFEKDIFLYFAQNLPSFNLFTNIALSTLPILALCRTRFI